MMRMSVVVLLLLLLAGCASMKEGIKPEDIALQPTVYANVLKEPDPLLLGGWKGTFSRYLEETGENDFNPIQYYLKQDGDRYALYFYRTSHRGRKRYEGWRDWTVYGNEITSPTGVTIFAKDGKVFFKFQESEPIEMTRMGRF